MAGCIAAFGKASYANPSSALTAVFSMEAMQAALKQLPLGLTEQLGDYTENFLDELNTLLENPITKRRLIPILPASIAGIL